MKSIGPKLLLEDLNDIILRPQQKLLPDDTLKRRRFEASVETQWMVFGRMTAEREERAERDCSA